VAEQTRLEVCQRRLNLDPLATRVAVRLRACRLPARGPSDPPGDLSRFPLWPDTDHGTTGRNQLGTWAWVHLIVGALVALTGSGLLSGDQPWARVAGMAIVGVSALVQLVFLPAAPLWSILVIALDIAILMALATSSGPPRRS
jgi:hypothetical protein